MQYTNAMKMTKRFLTMLMVVLIAPLFLAGCSSEGVNPQLVGVPSTAFQVHIGGTTFGAFLSYELDIDNAERYHGNSDYFDIRMYVRDTHEMNSLGRVREVSITRDCAGSNLDGLAGRILDGSVAYVGVLLRSGMDGVYRVPIVQSSIQVNRPAISVFGNTINIQTFRISDGVLTTQATTINVNNADVTREYNPNGNLRSLIVNTNWIEFFN